MGRGEFAQEEMRDETISGRAAHWKGRTLDGDGDGDGVER